VRPFFVVIPPPSFDLIPGVIQAEEPVLVEAFLPESAVEGLDIGVVGRLARTGKVQSDLIPIGPEIGKQLRFSESPAGDSSDISVLLPE
jgi:hypothetical protein